MLCVAIQNINFPDIVAVSSGSSRFSSVHCKHTRSFQKMNRKYIEQF